MIFESLLQLLLLLLLYSCISLVHCQTLTNPAIGQFPISFSSTTSTTRIFDSSDARVAQAQEFQTVYLVNPTDPKALPVMDFREGCDNTTTIMDLQQWNGNGVNVITGIKSTSKVALVKRGNCSWSQKVKTITQLSTTYQLNVTTLLIYNNETSSSAHSYTLLPATGTTTVPVYSSNSIATQDNITTMKDNDIIQNQTIIINQPNSIFYVTHDYGTDLLTWMTNCFQSISTQTNGAPTTYMTVVLLTSPFSWAATLGEDGSPNFLSWIIALAAFFLIAIIGLLLFFRWWRARQQREDLEYNAMLEARNMIMLQRRKKLKPLPVDLVNSYPIQNYQVNVIKNTSCAICLDDFEENQPDIRVLPCGHGFCVLCIDPWLTQKSTLCPICKYDCLPPELRENDDNNDENQGDQTVVGSHTDVTNHINNTTTTTTTTTTADDDNNTMDNRCQYEESTTNQDTAMTINHLTTKEESTITSSSAISSTSTSILEKPHVEINQTTESSSPSSATVTPIVSTNDHQEDMTKKS